MRMFCADSKQNRKTLQMQGFPLAGL